MDISELAMLLETMDSGEVPEEEFFNACENSKRIPNLQDDQRLQLYGLYKQGTVGNINTSRPMMLDLVGGAKWDAWKSFEGQQNSEKYPKALQFLMRINSTKKLPHCF